MRCLVQIALRGNIALAGLGITLPEPTTILTDSLSNRTVAENVGSANHCRHFLTRYDILKERIAAGEVRVVYVPDPENPSDYLSKFVDVTKMARSVDYAAGQIRGIREGVTAFPDADASELAGGVRAGR